MFLLPLSLVVAATACLLLGVRAEWTKLYSTTPSGARYGSRAAYCQLADSLILVDDFCDGLFRYDFETKTWHTITLLPNPAGGVPLKPVARSFFTFTSVGEDIAAQSCIHVVTSGKRVVPSVLNNAYVLRVFPRNNTAEWLLVNIISATRPAVRLSSNAVSLRAKTLHLFGGGVNSTQSLDDFWEFILQESDDGGTSLYTGRWREIRRKDGGAPDQFWPMARHAHAMVALDDNRLAVFGGRKYLTNENRQLAAGYAFLDELAIYTVSTNTWRTIGTGIQRSSHAMFAHGNSLIAFGGYRRSKSGLSLPFRDVLVANSVADAPPACFLHASNRTVVWCNASGTADSPQQQQQQPDARFEFASVQRRDSFVICGGLTMANGEQSSMQDIWSFNMSRAVITGAASPRQEDPMQDGDADDEDGEDDDHDHEGMPMSSLYFMITTIIFVLISSLFFAIWMKQRQRRLRREMDLRQRRQQQARAQVVIGVGASAEAIKALPSFTYSEDILDGETCAICLAEYERGDLLRELPCTHQFHAECVDKWLARTNACPMCKSAIRNEQVIPPANSDANSDNALAVL